MRTGNRLAHLIAGWSVLTPGNLDDAREQTQKAAVLGTAAVQFPAVRLGSLRPQLAMTSFSMR
jgi:hypothetical protein